MSFPVVNSTKEEFIKYISQSNLSESDFDNIIKTINESYIELAQQINLLHDKRTDLLIKLRETHNEYKKVMGHGEIQKIIDAENDGEDSDVEKIKTTKRGRKKEKVVEENIKEIEEDLKLDELEKQVLSQDLPKSKSKTKKIKEVEPEKKEVELEKKEEVKLEEVKINDPVKSKKNKDSKIDVKNNVNIELSKVEESKKKVKSKSKEEIKEIKEIKVVEESEVVETTTKKNTKKAK